MVHSSKTVVWTANRGRPVHARGAAVTLKKGSALVLMDYDGAVVWQAQGDNSVGVQYAELLDTGNLVMKNSSGIIVWQSFDSPTDTLLPGQRITATTKLVPTTGLHVPGHFIFHISITRTRRYCPFYMMMPMFMKYIGQTLTIRCIRITGFSIT